LLLHLMPDGQLQPDFDDVITRECCITHEREVQQDTGRVPVAAAA